MPLSAGGRLPRYRRTTLRASMSCCVQPAGTGAPEAEALGDAAALAAGLVEAGGGDPAADPPPDGFGAPAGTCVQPGAAPGARGAIPAATPATAAPRRKP